MIIKSFRGDYEVYLLLEAETHRELAGVLVILILGPSSIHLLLITYGRGKKRVENCTLALNTLSGCDMSFSHRERQAIGPEVSSTGQETLCLGGETNTWMILVFK